MNTKLKGIFITLCMKFTDNLDLAERFWKEVEENYSSSGRYYHTLAHLEYMLEQLQTVKLLVNDNDSLIFAIYYHDIIYTASKNDNEEKSAALAQHRLSQLGMPEEKMATCIQMILASKSHDANDNADINIFTDIDLAILGAPESIYDTYSKAVRKEFSIYPDFLYKPGRKKMLTHFLAMKGMYKTNVFAKKLEQQARENINREISTL